MDAVKGGSTVLNQDHTSPHMIFQCRKCASIVPTLSKMLRAIRRIIDSFLLQSLYNTLLLAHMIGNKAYKVDIHQKTVETTKVTHITGTKTHIRVGG